MNNFYANTIRGFLPKKLPILLYRMGNARPEAIAHCWSASLSRRHRHHLRRLLPVLAATLLTACTALAELGENSTAADSQYGLMSYFQQLQRMTPQALARERSRLTPTPQSPAAQVRLAMLLGQTHAPNDLSRANGLLGALMKSNAPEAVRLHPLIQLLSAQYHERAKTEAQNEKLAQQLKESQQQNEKLQEKLSAIADIENTLQSRPRNSRSTSRRTR